jgi:hypothetical protein
MWNVTAKVIPVITGATGTILKITRIVPEQHNGKARSYGTAKNSHIGHFTLIVGSANVKVQNVFHMRSNITCGTDCKYRTAATLYTLETWFVSGI